MFRRRRRRPSETPGPGTDEVPMTPMIDIVFQLLIFFMLTMQFKEVEGKLMSQLPKDKGDRPIPSEVLPEVRIVLCAGGDVRKHTTDKGAHDRTPKDGTECVVLVERHEIGRVRKTEAVASAAAGNRKVYVETASRARALREVVTRESPDGSPAALILDADSEVPYEHVIGVINGLKEEGINDVEFAANPRHRLPAR